jgi:CRP-like cAMP-binding protein
MQNHLLACLTGPDLALLAPHLVQLPLIQGAVLHEPETAMETIYFPLSGAVSLLAIMNKGETVEIANVGREGAVGLFAHSGVWRARSKAVVQIPGISFAIPLAVFRTALSRSDHMRDVIIRYKETLVAQTQQLAACNALHSVEQRMARWLLQVSERIGSPEIPVTKNTISGVLAVRRTSITLVAKKLQQAGFIRYGRGQITIADAPGLHLLVCECYEFNRQTDALWEKDDLGARASA